MSILKSRIFRVIALLGCAAFCGVLIVGCNSSDDSNATSGGGSPKTGGTMAPGSGGTMAPGSAGS